MSFKTASCNSIIQGIFPGLPSKTTRPVLDLPSLSGSCLQRTCISPDVKDLRSDLIPPLDYRLDLSTWQITQAWKTHALVHAFGPHVFS